MRRVLPTPSFSLGSAAIFLAASSLMLLAAGSASAITTDLLLLPTGESVGDQLGYSTATAGDVNGDGYADVIVGAPYNDAGGTTAGRAYLYYGGSGADAVPDLTFTGAAVGDFFGASVGTAGDVNGDGYDDVIVGAPNTSSGGNAYVYYGGPGADNVADLTMTGLTVEDVFGTVVGTAGDVNGDGYDDVVVSAPYSEGGGIERGQVRVFFGGTAPDAIPDLTFTGEMDGDVLGVSAGTAGDVNGDGYADIIAGTEANSAGGAQAGRAYVFYGGPSADTMADLIFTGGAADEFLGFSSGTAGDVNGDGYDDVVVGAPGYDAPGADVGRTYVYFGGPGADNVADLAFTGEAVDDLFGINVGAAGDVNGDGLGDLIIGARGHDTGASNAGRVYVYFGGATADTIPDAVFTGSGLNDAWSGAVGTAGDVDGDGLDDIIFGARYDDFGASNVGRAFVYSLYAYRLDSPNGGERWVAGRPATVRWEGYDLADLDISLNGGASWSTLTSSVGGGAINEISVTVPGLRTDVALVRLTYAGEVTTAFNSNASAAPFEIVSPARPVAHLLQVAPTGQTGSDSFGGSVASAGDFSGDGFDDVIVGARRHDSETGAAYLYFGGPGADAAVDLTLTGAAIGDEFGGSVACAGDVNGDGYPDVIVGASLNDGKGVDAGAAYLYHGGPGADAVIDKTFTGETPGDQFGVSVGTAGDVNGDGYADLIIGAFRNASGGTAAGRAYVYYGGPALDNNPELTFTGEAASEYLGYSVSTAGDVNGDGYDDMIVGAYRSSTPATETGRAFVYYGGPGADAIADATFTGEAADDWFGSSVGTVGDINGDGYSDLIVGSPRNDDAGTDAGRAYVFHGGPLADTVADLTLTGEAAGDWFGRPAASAGDIDGDGFLDIAVGARYHDGGGTHTGRTYIFQGGPGADDKPEFVLTGEAASDYFGGSVGTAGDVNGDGFADVIVGAEGNDDAGSAAGKAYLYDFNRYHVLSPSAGETWNVGASETVEWLGSEPADLWLSVDGGDSYSLLDGDVGGSVANAASLTVPHQPTRFAKIKVAPHDVSVSGKARTDSLFTIEASIALLGLKAEPGDGGGVLLTWSTEPGLEDLAGYRVERSPSGSDTWVVLASRVRATEYHDATGSAGMRYRLSGINGLGEELLLGEIALTPRAALAAWPIPYRGGALNLSFTTYGGRTGAAKVVVYDVRGRLVRTVVDGSFPAGSQVARWDGRDETGRDVPTGVYFLRALSAGENNQIKVMVLR